MSPLNLSQFQIVTVTVQIVDNFNDVYTHETP